MRFRPANAIYIAAGITLLITMFNREFSSERPRDQLQPAEDAARRAASEKGRGRQAEHPAAIPPKGLRDVFWRVVSDISKDRVTMIAAGVTYYLLLAMFPSLAVLVSLYGLVADPAQIGSRLSSFAAALPPGSFDLVLDQLKSLTAQKTSTLSFAFVAGFLVALWSAHSGVLALFEAMNVAYEETEKRSFIRLNLTAFCFTIGALIMVIILSALVAAVPVVLNYLWLDRWVEDLALFMRWPVMFVLAMGIIAAIYRIGPSRQPAKFRWITWGAALASLVWVLMSVAFGFYLNRFANYNATYGTLGALIGLLVWMWLSVVILIVGAELNAELEHQTVKDSTTGAPRPMGLRGAVVADTLGEIADR
ncbi:MAG: YihY/virulence factor BrkB family protein [Rhizobiaceae bacterium]|nr:YihY/virulence factor BrkB family protein [Rhizobiaceae bacterium]